MPGTGRYLLDTNIVIAVFAGEESVLSRVEAAAAVFVPVIVLGELFYGARQSARSQANIERLHAFAATAALLACDAGTAMAYGEVKAILRSQGTPLPENDVWIAALARQHDLPVVSRDRHFEAVPELTVERWEAASGPHNG